MIMSFTPSTAPADQVIQVAVDTTLDVKGQIAEVDSTLAAVTIKLPDGAVDGAEFGIRWKAGANAVNIVGDTVDNYKTQLEDGTLVSPLQVVPVVNALVSFVFSRATPYTGVGTGTGSFLRN
jgi:hypothetical protein